MNEGAGQRARTLGRRLVYLASASTPEEHGRSPCHPGTESGAPYLVPGPQILQTGNASRTDAYVASRTEYPLADAFCSFFVSVFPMELPGVGFIKMSEKLSTSPSQRILQQPGAQLSLGELQLGLALSPSGWSPVRLGGLGSWSARSPPGSPATLEDGPLLVGKAGAEHSVWASQDMGGQHQRPSSPPAGAPVNTLCGSVLPSSVAPAIADIFVSGQSL